MANRRGARKSRSAKKSSVSSRAKKGAGKAKAGENKSKGRIVNEFVGLLLIGSALLLVSGAFVEERGLVYLLGEYLRHAFGAAIWYISFVLVFFCVIKFRGLPVCAGYVSFLSWLFLLPVLCAFFQAFGGWTGFTEPGGRVGWVFYHLLATLTSPVSGTIIIILTLLLLLMLAFDLPLSEMIDMPGRAVLAIVSGLVFLLWLPFVFLHKLIHLFLISLHRFVYWVIEDLSTIGEYLVKTVFGKQASMSRRVIPAKSIDPDGAKKEKGPLAALVESSPANGVGAANEPGGAAKEAAQSSEPPDALKEPAPLRSPDADKEHSLPLEQAAAKDRKPAIEKPAASALQIPIEEPYAPSSNSTRGDSEYSEAGDPLEKIEKRAKKAEKGAQLRLWTEVGQKKKAANAWKQPSLALFEPPPKERKGESDAYLQSRAGLLVDTLAQFKIEAEVIKIVPGPTITQFQIKPASGIKLSKITSLANDIAMALACRSVRIEAPIPGKSAVGIEVPNENPESVLFSEIVSSKSYAGARTNSFLSFALGKSISGKPIIADLRKMPHLLVAGATGAGKSVCINSILASVLYQARPDQVRLLMIDPKMVELMAYKDVPHLVTDVVTNPQEAGTALRWAVLEMERRYRYLSQYGVRNIDSFNRQVMDGELYDENGDPVEDAKTMPYMLVIIDELSDLMMVAAKEVEGAICRLAQMARAVGMHLVIATQRPSTNVITGVIKANLPSRIAFAVSSKVDSKVILDTIGADALLGRGDMLYLPVGQAKPMRVQGAYISEAEVKRLTTHLKEQGDADYVDINADLVEASAPAEPAEQALSDDMWEPALKIAVELGEVSTSLLQRHLNIGYNRAARIVDGMFERGIISGQESGRRRKVLIAEEQISEYVK